MYLSDGLSPAVVLQGGTCKKCAFRAFSRSFLVKYYFFTLLKTAAF